MSFVFTLLFLLLALCGVCMDLYIGWWEIECEV